MKLVKKEKLNFVKSNFDIDLAIFKKTKDFGDVDELSIGDDSLLKQGDKIIVVGFPQYNPGDMPYVNDGKIVQYTRYLGGEFWLVDIPILHGTSGGVVLNENLEVVGVATIGSAAHDSSTKFHGFIPVSRLVDFSK